ncbi:MAG TPA: MauE/DoxX family redox-associated membrane protein [Bacteroidia bacterium]|nr:MauE/DoxX family redox-associated membrane protein [Bacteroidia bacterium]
MKLILLYIMAVLYVAAGVYHFINPKFYQKIMPTYLPWHMPLIYISGVLEIAFGLLLIPESTRPMAAWLVIALLIAVFPANVQMLVNWVQKQRPNLWIAILRLPLQLVLIYWAWIYTKK